MRAATMATRSATKRAKTATPRPKKNGMRRADKLAATRRKLMEAVTEIVGGEGYGNASVAKITARARVAQGTFYNYFKSQQDLFDRLLPELGTQLLDRIRSRVANHPVDLKREEIGFRAFFDFLADTPEFYRILNEAETFSPKAFRDHMSNMIQGYLRALRRSQEQGGLPGYSADDLEVIVCILLGARNYLSDHYMVRTRHVGPAPDWMVRAYMKFVADGLLYGGTSGPTYRPKRLSATDKDAARGKVSGGRGKVEKNTIAQGAGRTAIAVANAQLQLGTEVVDGNDAPTFTAGGIFIRGAEPFRPVGRTAGTAVEQPAGDEFHIGPHHPIRCRTDMPRAHHVVIAEIVAGAEEDADDYFEIVGARNYLSYHY